MNQILTDPGHGAKIAGGKVPTDRIIDGVDQSQFLLGKQKKSKREPERSRSRRPRAATGGGAETATVARGRSHCGTTSRLF